MPKFNHQNFGDIQKYVYLLARVLSVNGADDTASLALTDTALVASGIPIFFHCAMDSEQRENGALVGAAGAFREEDSVIVRCRLDDSGATITPVCVVARDQGPRTCCEWFEEIGSTICQNHNWRVPYAIPYYQLNPPGDDGWFAMCGTLPYYKLWTATLGGLGLFLIEVDCSLSDGKYHAKNKVNILRESDRFFEEYPYGLYWKASDNPGDLPQKDGVLKFNFSNVQTEVYRGEGAIDHVDYLRGQVYIKIFWDSGLPVEIIVSRSIYSYHDPYMPPEMVDRTIILSHENGKEYSIDLSDYYDESMGEISRMLVGCAAIAEQPLTSTFGWTIAGDPVDLWALAEYTLDYFKICST